MKSFICTFFGAAAGTLLYWRFLSNSHTLDWERAFFVGLFAGLIMATVSLAQSKKKRE